MPVPLHKLKKAERGYNQSYYIAKGYSNILNIPVKEVCRRIKYTVSQTGFNLKERKENMRNAFLPTNTKIISGKRIILVDDVITTGSTITECAKVLLDNGAGKVFAVSVALAD